MLPSIMNLSSLIDEVASAADDFLVDAHTPGETREAISQWVEENHPDLSKKERNVVVNGVVSILQQEEFFSSNRPADRWSDDGVDE